MTTRSPDPDPLDPATEAPPSPPRVKVPRLRFQAPESPSSPLESSPETASAASAGPASGDAPPTSDGPLEPPSTPSGSSPTSSPGKGPASKADRQLIHDTTAHVVQSASVTAHQLLARDRAEQAVGLYLTDEQDEQGIAEPVAGLLSRHGVGEGLGGNTDLADLIALGIAVAMYVIKQLRKMGVVRALRAGEQPAPGFEAAAGSDDPGAQQ